MKSLDEETSEKFAGVNLHTSEELLESTSYSYVTSPKLKRKSRSQRTRNKDRLSIAPYHGKEEAYSSDEETAEYIVQEPNDGIGEDSEEHFRSSSLPAEENRNFPEDSAPSVAHVEEAVVPKEQKPSSAEVPGRIQHVESSEGKSLENGAAQLQGTKSLLKDLDLISGKPETQESTEEPEDPSLNETSAKPRVIFYVESEEDGQSDWDSDVQNTIDRNSELFLEKVREDLIKSLQREQFIIDDRLTGMRSGVFDDLSDESLLRTKELVDERLRKISETKSIDETMLKKDKSPARTVEQFKIGRFHVTTSLDTPLDEEAEKKIADKLKVDREGEEIREEVERELPEKLSDEGFAEVMKEIGKKSMQLPLDEKGKSERKERTLRRVERRYERMASETLEREKEEENGEFTT